MVARFIASSCSLTRPFRLALVLITLLLTLPQTAWGVTEEVTKTITFNKAVDDVSSNINHSTMSVSVKEQVTGGASTTYDGKVNILDDNSLLTQYNSTTDGAVFTLKSTAIYGQIFTIEIPGNYPAIPTQVTLKVGWDHAKSSGATDEIVAKIQVGDYDSGSLTGSGATDPTVIAYANNHPFLSNQVSLQRFSNPLKYTANSTNNLGTNRETRKSLFIYVSLNGNDVQQYPTTFTIKEATITYNREAYGPVVAGVHVGDDNAANIFNDGTASYNNTTNTLTLDAIDQTYAVADGSFIDCGSSSLTVHLASLNNELTLGSNASAFSGSAITFTAEDANSALTIHKNSWTGVLFKNGGTEISATYNSHLYLSPDANNNTYVIQNLAAPLIICGTYNGVFSFGSDNTSCNDEAIYYSIDYVDGNDVNDVLYTSEVTVDGPCTMTYYITAGGGQSETLSAKYFGISTNEIATTSGTPVTIPTILPAINYDDIDVFDYQYNSVGYDPSTGKITSTNVGETYCHIEISQSLFGNLGYTILNRTNNSGNVEFGNFTLIVAGNVLTINGNSPAADGSITGTGISSGTVTYNATNKTLTLNDATIDGPILWTSDEALTIEFTGTNTLAEANGQGTSGYISNSNYGAHLTIKGTGTSTLLLNNSDNHSAVEGFADVTLDGAYMYSNNCCKYIAGNTRKYQSPHNNVIVQKIKFTTTPQYLLWIGDRQVSYENKDDIFDDANYNNPITATFEPASNTLTLNGLSWCSQFGIESDLDNLTISLIGNNTVYATYYRGYNSIFSIKENAELTIKQAGDAVCKLDLMTYGEDQVIKGFASVNYSGLNFASKTGTTLDGADTKDAILTSATIYPLWVGGTLVTAANSSGTGWSYDNDQKKLTLTNYSKTDNDGHAFISNMANLNVYLVGTNSVGPNSQISTDKAFYTTYTDATLTFSTDENNKGTLSASGYNTFCEGFRTVNGIYCNNGLGYFPGSREIKAKATPTIKFAKRNQGTGDEISPTEYVGADETIQTAIGYVFKAPNPTFDNGYEIFPDSTRYVYSYSVDGVVEFPTTGTNTNNPTRTDYGEINLLKAGTVTITCTFPGNMQNNPCSASYTLQVDKAILILSGTNTPNTACICVDGSWHWGNAPDNYFPAPDITIPNDVTAFTYSSSNTDVATVNSTTGEITPVGPGSATITLYIVDDPKYQDTDYPIDLTVMVPATISFANATASMSNTETYTQTATTVPTGATIVYSSSNNDVNVDANGEVTINNSFYGTATITATVTAVPAANPQYYYVQSNNAAFQATYKLTVSKVFNDVTFANGQNYATYYNENEDMTVPEGLTAYLVTGTSGNSVVTYPVNYLAKSVPLLLEKSTTAGSTLTNTIYSGTELTNAEKSSNLLQYADGDQDVDNLSTAGGTPYVLYKNEFVKATGTIPQNHCYLLITGHAPSRGYYSIGNGNDGSTAIDATHIDNGEMANENWYDLQGRRIERPTKPGLYIRNGKKVVVNNK